MTHTKDADLLTLWVVETWKPEDQPTWTTAAADASSPTTLYLKVQF